MKSSNGPVIHWCYHFLYHSEAASMIEQWNDLLMFVTMPAIWQCLACLGHISPGDCLFSVYKLWHCFFLIQYSLVRESRYGNWSSTTHYYSQLSISQNFAIYSHDFVIHWPRDLSFREKFTPARKHIDSIELEVKTFVQLLCSSHTSESTDEGWSYWSNRS